MCKHVLNAQVAIRAPCCKKWYDCPECHSEASDHPLLKVNDVTMACKKCKKVFRKDPSNFDEADEYCPHCDNHYVLPAHTPQAAIGFEAEDLRVVGDKLIKDERMKQKVHDPADF